MKHIAENNTLRVVPYEIMELLFLNITIPLEIIKQIIDKIESGEIENIRTHLRKLKYKLKDGLRFEKEMAEKSDVAKSELSTRARKRIDEWSEEFGKVHLKDILKMAKFFEIPSMQIIDVSYMNPNAIKDTLSDYVIGQEEYLSKLSLVFYMHYLRTLRKKDNLYDFPRANLLVYGPTGVGKTFSVQMLAKQFNLSVGIVNCNSLVQEGIMGQQVTDVFTELYLKNDKNLKAVEHSIVFFDEFDKLLEKGQFNERIINEILSIIDDDGSVFFNATYGNRNYENIRLSTKNMLFIFTGVFGGLQNAVKQRMSGGIGYSNQLNRTEMPNFYENVCLEDFKKLNIKQEILGRIHDFTHVKELTSEAVKNIILVSNESPILEYKEYFAKHGVSLVLSEDGAKELAEYTVKKKLGARGVKSLLWQVLSKDMSEVEVLGKIKKKLILDKNYVNKRLSL